MSKSTDAFNLLTQLSKTETDALITLVAKNAWWVHPEVCKEIDGAVYPMTRRAKKGEKGGAVVTPNGVRVQDNSQAHQAFFPALRKSPEDFENPNVCHIYGAKEGGLGKDHFTNLANMVLLPQALESLSEFEPINQALRRRSYRLYGYSGPDGAEPPKLTKHYPWREPDSLSQEEIKDIVARLRGRQERDLKRAADFVRRRKG